jgi:hypothetical protein
VGGTDLPYLPNQLYAAAGSGNRPTAVRFMIHVAALPKILWAINLFPPGEIDSPLPNQFTCP